MLSDPGDLPTAFYDAVEALLKYLGFFRRKGDPAMSFVSQSKPGYFLDSDKGMTTFLIKARKTKKSKHEGQLSAAIHAVPFASQALFSQLQKNDIEAEIEIIDLKRCYSPAFSHVPLKFDEHTAYTRAFDSFKQDMASDVERCLSSVWKRISLFRIGRTGKTSTQASGYAVGILVLPFTEHDWQNLKSELEDRHIRSGIRPWNRMDIHFIPFFTSQDPGSYLNATRRCVTREAFTNENNNTGNVS